MRVSVLVRAACLGVALLPVAACDEADLGPPPQSHVTISVSPLPLPTSACQAQTPSEQTWAGPRRNASDGAGAEPGSAVMQDVEQGFVDVAINWESRRLVGGLERVGDACFSIEVRRPDGVTTALAEGLCASRYGAGGSRGVGVTYVTTCDPAAGARADVTVRLEQACGAKSGRSLDTADMPCVDGCSYEVACQANRDTSLFIAF